MLELILIIAAAVFLLPILFPKTATPTDRPALPAYVPISAAKPAGSSYLDAVASLGDVRKRLSAAEGLTEEAKKALEILTLALQAGSEK
jgi:hypothetical protein